MNDAILRSDQVKGSNYIDKLRRRRVGTLRLVFVKLPAIDNFKLPNNRDCYIVVACGPKSSDYRIYKYSTSLKIGKLYNEFFNMIKSKVEEINSMNISQEEKDDAVLEWFNNLVKENNTLFDKYICGDEDSLKNERGVL